MLYPPTTTTTFLFLTELLINAIIVEIYLCNNYKKKVFWNEIHCKHRTIWTNSRPRTAKVGWNPLYMSLAMIFKEILHECYEMTQCSP